ncbi:hypothetical protein AOQ84DRAFT_112580 [Glonium stellatum]|uniref:Rhodopsin domain-containing protein n=1 Tax=Glonium stellatum TaxID=574774 RepID=A0A8E2JPB7_9PEZI|nr:hypothetical protein AOQ84DRAFT_112580 [Glonium stellatum]
MADILKPDGPDVNIGGRLMKVQWALAGVSFVVLALRLVAGVYILGRVRLADYLMVMAFICGVVQAAIFTDAYYWGMGRHFYYLSDQERVESVKLMYYGMGWGVACTMFGRLSFCCFLVRFVSVYQLRRFLLWAFVYGQMIIGSLTIILIYVQCGSHLSALWTGDEKGEHCWVPAVQRDFGYFQSGGFPVPQHFYTSGIFHLALI